LSKAGGFKHFLYTFIGNRVGFKSANSPSFLGQFEKFINLHVTYTSFLSARRDKATSAASFVSPANPSAPISFANYLAPRNELFHPGDRFLDFYKELFWHGLAPFPECLRFRAI
jgi:hypothetical protein